MDDETREFVRHRAGNRCEYCRIQQRLYPEFTFHIEHIVARQHHGSHDPDNLALACHLCNSKKGPNLSGIDSESGELTRLFNPRVDDWDEHFRIEESGEIIGMTKIGRTSVYVLGMNSGIRPQIRREALRLEAEDNA